MGVGRGIPLEFLSRLLNVALELQWNTDIRITFVHNN